MSAASGGARPIVELLSLLGRRWALRALWELRGGPLTFRALSGACGGVPSASLNTRLGELRRAGVVALDADGYRLTPRGRDLGAVLLDLNRWAKRWPEASSWQGPGSGGGR